MTGQPGADFVNRQHAAAAVLATWLVLTSPWIAMLGKVPTSAGFLDYAHVVLGIVALVVSIGYAMSCLRVGGFRLYFPWAAGDLSLVSRDLSGLLRGRAPASEGGGLFAAIEGLLLVAFVVTAASGTIWLVTQGTDLALAWRGYHLVAARVFAGLLVVHVLAVASHLRDFLG